MIRLYVALIRSKSDLILVIDKYGIKKFTDKQIEERFAELGISYDTMEYREKIESRNKFQDKVSIQATVVIQFYDKYGG